MDDLTGELGQDEFKKWCSTHGMIASPPTPDRMGWDFLVEWEPDRQSGPLDSQNDLPKALVQIKTTRSNTRPTSVSAKLSALKKLVDTELATFIVHLRYRDGVLIEAQLLHVGPVEIGKILHRIRDAEAHSKKIHKIRFSLPMGQAQTIAIDGSNLKALLAEGLKKPFAAGVSRKSDYVQSVGYEDGLGGIHVQFQGNPETLVDHWVGLTPSWHFNSAKYEYKRFGIALDEQTRSEKNGEITITPLPIAEISATIVKGGSQILSKTILDVTAPPTQIADPTRTKYLISNDFIGFLLDFSHGELTSTATVSADADVLYKWEKLSEILGFVFHLSTSDTQIRFDFQDIDPVFLDGPLIIPNVDFWRGLFSFLQLVSTTISKTAGFIPPKMTLNQLLKIAQENNTELDLLFAKKRHYECKFDKTLDNDIQFSSAQSVVGVSINFGTFVYSAILHFQSDNIDADSDLSFQVEFGPPKILEETIYMEYGERQQVQVSQRLTEILLCYQKENMFVIPMNDLDP